MKMNEEQVKEQFLAKLTKDGYICVYEPIREILGLVEGDLLRVTIWKDFVRTPIDPVVENMPVESVLESPIKEPIVEPVVDTEPEVEEEIKVIPEKELPENVKWVTCKSCLHKFSVPLDTVGYDCPECKHKFPPRPMIPVVKPEPNEDINEEITESLIKDVVEEPEGEEEPKEEQSPEPEPEESIEEITESLIEDVTEELAVEEEPEKDVAEEPEEKLDKEDLKEITEKDESWGQEHVDPCVHALDWPLQDQETCQEWDCEHYKRKDGMSPAECTWPGWKKVGWEDEVEEDIAEEPAEEELETIEEVLDPKEEQKYEELCPNFLEYPLQDLETCAACEHYKKKVCTWPEWKKIDGEKAVEEEPEEDMVERSLEEEDVELPPTEEVTSVTEVKEDTVKVILEPEPDEVENDELVMRVCESGAHEAKIVDHRKNVHRHGWVTYTCTICNHETIMKISEEDKVK